MSVFLLRIMKKLDSPSRVIKLPAESGLSSFFTWTGGRITFWVYASSGEARPQMEQNGNAFLYIHGRSPNATLANYSDTTALNGNFNIVVVNKAEGIVEIIKDACNSLNTFFYEDENEVIFTSNPLLIGHQGLTLDRQAISQYFLCYQGFWPGNYFYREIKKIQRGSLYKVVCSHDSTSIDYCQKRDEPRAVSYEDFITNFDSIIRANACSLSSSPCYSDFTGGYDSRLINAGLLHNNIPFRPVVYGEGDPEVVFVTKLARKINLPLSAISIRDHIAKGCQDWKRFFWLSGGSYNLFEAVKEGTRGELRSHFGCYRFTGGIGETLRDKWYVDKLLRSRLEREGLHAAIERKLITMPIVPYSWLHAEFQREMDAFSTRFRDVIRSETLPIGKSNETQAFMNALFERYVCGWLGTLYGFHGNLVTIIAPYIDNRFLAQCAYVDPEFRRHGSGMTNAIITYAPVFKRTRFFDGQQCRSPKGLALLDYYRSEYWLFCKSRIMREKGVIEYDHSEWLRLLLADGEFSDRISAKDDSFEEIIAGDQFGDLIKRGLSSSLDRSSYDFMWKLISLKLSLTSG
jgi:hypothetical protein